jgi:hypothetical protein
VAEWSIVFPKAPNRDRLLGAVEVGTVTARVRRVSTPRHHLVIRHSREYRDLADGEPRFAVAILDRLRERLDKCPDPGRIAMRSAFALTAVAALGIVSSSSAAFAQYDCDYFYQRCHGFVVPCSLDGVNPANHPSIFGNPVVAREQYGFVRSRDGAWHVVPNCVRGPYHGG